MTKTIEKNKVSDFLAKLNGWDIYGPTDSGGVTLFKKLDSEPILDFENSKKPESSATP